MESGWASSSSGHRNSRCGCEGSPKDSWNQSPATPGQLPCSPLPSLERTFGGCSASQIWPGQMSRLGLPQHPLHQPERNSSLVQNISHHETRHTQAGGPDLSAPRLLHSTSAGSTGPRSPTRRARGQQGLGASSHPCTSRSYRREEEGGGGRRRPSTKVHSVAEQSLVRLSPPKTQGGCQCVPFSGTVVPSCQVLARQAWEILDMAHFPLS